jgi:hypothetical protein
MYRLPDDYSLDQKLGSRTLELMNNSPVILPSYDVDELDRLTHLSGLFKEGKEVTVEFDFVRSLERLRIPRKKDGSFPDFLQLAGGTIRKESSEYVLGDVGVIIGRYDVPLNFYSLPKKRTFFSLKDYTSEELLKIYEEVDRLWQQS